MKLTIKQLRKVIRESILLAENNQDALQQRIEYYIEEHGMSPEEAMQAAYADGVY